jgi:hypothetical protein
MIIAVILSLTVFVISKKPHEEEHSVVSPKGDAQKSTQLRIVAKYIRADPVQLYRPRSLFMVYYRLNKIPSLSPIDVWINLQIINAETAPLKIESWSIETATTSLGGHPKPAIGGHLKTGQ